MSKHAAQRSSKKAIAALVTGGLSFGLGATVHANGGPTGFEVCGDALEQGISWYVVDEENQICEMSLGAAAGGVVEIPAGAQKLGVLLIGSGGSVYYNGITYAGQGGDVQYFEFDNPSGTLSNFESSMQPSSNTSITYSDAGTLTAAGGGSAGFNSGFPTTNPTTLRTLHQQEELSIDLSLWEPLGYYSYWNAADGWPQNWLGADWLDTNLGGNTFDFELPSFGSATVSPNLMHYGAGGNATAVDTESYVGDPLTGSGFYGTAVVRISFAPAQDPAPASAQYEGPVALMVQRTGVPAGTRATATAQRMSGITRVLVDGVSVDFKIESDTKLTFLLPANLKPGTYSVHFEVGPNTTLTDKVYVSRVASSASTYQANRLFANYQGDNQSVAASDAAAISSFVSKYKNITSITCIGSTSGIPAEPTDQALALSRAKNACDLIQKQVPGATITLKTSVGKGVGQKFRSVQVFLQGNK